MPVIKRNEQMLQFRRERIAWEKGYRDRLAIFRDHKESVFWKTLKEHLKLSIENADLKIGAELGRVSADPLAELANCKYNYGAKKFAEEIIEVVESADAHLDRVTEKISGLEQDLKNIMEEVHAEG